MYKAVFFDRDGVLNKEKKDYVKSVKDLEIYENISTCIKKLKNNGFKIIVITNQSAVNRKLTDHDNIKKIHDAIQHYLKTNGTQIDRFYYCPHLPDEKCFCRKPNPGLLKMAAYEMNINLETSWMIGDNDSDVLAGKNAGCMTIKIKNNNELNDAVDYILNAYTELR